jgi:hypothetical protein
MSQGTWLLLTSIVPDKQEKLVRIKKWITGYNVFMSLGSLVKWMF